MPLSRWLQRVEFKSAEVRTGIFYRWRLRSCGHKAIVCRPLFWTPECISIGSRVLIWPNCRLEGITQYGNLKFAPHIDIADDVSFQQNCHVVAAGRLSIGEGTTISFDVMITDTDHSHIAADQNVLDQPLVHRPTEIGRYCFIGAGARVLAGTTLGDNCVVGANAVVRGCYPAGTVLAGVPARPLLDRQRTSESRSALC